MDIPDNKVIYMAGVLDVLRRENPQLIGLVYMAETLAGWDRYHSDLMNIPETALFLRIQPKDVRAMIARRELPGAFILPGGKALRPRWRVSRSALAEWIAKNSITLRDY